MVIVLSTSRILKFIITLSVLVLVSPIQAQTGADPAPEAGVVTVVKKLELADIQRLFANLNDEQKQTYLKDEDSFRTFVASESANQSLFAAARNSKLDQEENISFLMQRAADNVLRETYVNRVMRQYMEKNYPEGYPTEEHVKEFYDRNKDERYTVEERVHIWHIFLHKDSAADIAELEKKASDIIQQIKTGELDFASAAIRYSDNVKSGVNGGYMGLFALSTLKPEIREAVMSLPVETLSRPVRQEDGIHILMRGNTIPEQHFTMEQVSSDIRNELTRSASTQLQKAIIEESSRKFQVDIDQSKLEEWRKALSGSN